MIKEKNLHYDDAVKLKETYVNKLQALCGHYFSEASSELIYLEMMSYLSDLMNQYINSIDKRHYYKYAKLLQLKKTDVQNERLLVQFNGKESAYATKEYIYQNNSYHLQHDMDMLPSIVNIYHYDGYKDYKIALFLNDEMGGFPIWKQDTILKIVFHEKLMVNKNYCIYFTIKNVKERNQTRSKNYHFSTWRLSYQGEEKIENAEILEDNTYDFLYSGTIRFTLTKTMCTPILQLSFDEMNYDEIPVILQMIGNTDVMEQKKIYAKTYKMNNKQILPKGISLNQFLVLSKRKENIYTALSNEIYFDFNGVCCLKDKVDNLLFVYQSEYLRQLNIKALKGVVKEKIQLPKHMQIASLRLAVLHDDTYQEIEVCDYWQGHPKQMLGCYLDKEDNTITFGSGNDYLLPKKGSQLIILELIVYDAQNSKEHTKKDSDKSFHVVKKLRSFQDEESIQNVLTRASGVFLRKECCINKEDYINRAYTLPMSRFLFLDYDEEERVLLYDCGVKMEQAFEQYLCEYMNRYTMINREITLKQVGYIDIDVILKTEDIACNEEIIKAEITQLINQKQYDNVLKIKKKLHRKYDITMLQFYVGQQEIYYLHHFYDRRFRIVNFEISVCI